MQRTLGLILLAIGTGVAAVYGAWLPGSGAADHRARMAAEAHTQMAGALDKARKAATDDAEKARLDALAAKAAPTVPTGADGKPLTPARGGAAVSMWAGEAGLPFGVGVLLVIVGVVLARRGIKADAASGHAEAHASGTSTGALLDRLVAETAALAERFGGAVPEGATDLPDLEAVRAAVEVVQRELVTPLVDGREQVQQEYGVAAFAEVYVPFAAAERQLNRAWSASVDGYVDEVGPCVVAASVSSAAALAAYHRVTA